MPHPRDPGLETAFWMGLRALVPLAMLGIAAVSALVFVEPDPAPGNQDPVQVVAAPVILPVAPPPPQPARSAAPALVWTRDLAAPPRPLLRIPSDVTPQDLCAALAGSGWAMSGWTDSQIGPELGECMGERRFGETEGESRAGNAFLMLRGNAEGSLREIRLKLNIRDPDKGDEAAREALAMLRTVFDGLRWNLPPEVAEAVTARRTFSQDLAGTRLRFWREAGDVERYNLRLEMPTAPPPTDRFTRWRPMTVASAAPADGRVR